jgi:hypothetical protein
MAAAAAAGGALVVTVPAVSTPVHSAVSAVADDTYVRPAAAELDDVRMITSIVPVTHESEPPEVDVSHLVKASGLYEEARALAERQAAATCDIDLGNLGPVKPWVRSAARFLACLYDEDEDELIGVAQRSRHSDHPTGLALDLMVRGEKGDRIARCALVNKDELGVDYVIWKQRINYGDGWERMADRGGITENHYDHVHISFKRGSGGDDAPLVERCT